MDDGWRSLGDDETAIIQRLLEVQFEGRDDYLTQLPLLRVRELASCAGHCGSLEIEASGGNVDRRYAETEREHLLPIEGRVIDIDEVPIDIMLWSKHGWLSYLEYVVYSEQRKGPISADAMEIIDRRCGMT